MTIDQLAVARRPKTVGGIDTVLRYFARHVSRTDPTVTTVAAIRRPHVETWAHALNSAPGEHGEILQPAGLREAE